MRYTSLLWLKDIVSDSLFNITDQNIDLCFTFDANPYNFPVGLDIPEYVTSNNEERPRDQRIKDMIKRFVKPIKILKIYC